jgi:uncharacterized protein (DUF1697 family)
VARLIVLLRGVNLVTRNRVAMPVLREALGEAGFEDVRTYVQSGNVVLATKRTPVRVAREVAEVIAERFGLDIAVIVRTRAELAEVIDRNPLGSVVTDPKRCQVTFLGGKPNPEALGKLEAAASGGEVVELVGHEVYTWHPSGMGQSKLARLLSGKALGVAATSRNWATVTALLALADEP